MVKNRRPIFNARASNPWSKDDTKFGQRMLEKMGWKKGDGLGTHKQGITENIKVNLKLDSKGLGFKVSDQAQWLKVENSFSDVLSRLNGVEDTDVVTTQSSSNFTKSLESESMKSRSRVHYRKFTRGKDVSRYNEKDLLGILGQNTKRSTEGNAELQHDVGFQSKEQDMEHDECPENEESVIPKIDSSLPKKNKRPKMCDKSLVKSTSISSDAVTDTNSDEANVIDTEVMKIRRAKKHKHDECPENEKSVIPEIDSSLPKKNKRSKMCDKSLVKSTSISSDAVTDTNSDDANVIDTEVMKIRKARKHKKRSLIVETDVMESVPLKKKQPNVNDESNWNSNFESISRDMSVPEDVNKNNASLNTAHIEDEMVKDEEEGIVSRSASSQLPVSNIDESQSERRKLTKAERLVERNSLLKRLLHKDVSHEFTGSNLTNINGYGNCGTV